MKSKIRILNYSSLFLVLIVLLLNFTATSQTFNLSNMCGESSNLPQIMEPNEALRKIQDEQITALSCGNGSVDYLNKYSKQSFYIPKTTDSVITLKITFHVINNTAGTVGPWLGVPGLNALQLTGGYMHNWTERYSAPRNATYTLPFSCNYPFISDSKINYELTNIYFYNDDAMNTSTSGTAIGNYINGIDPTRLDEGLPIVFNSGSYIGAAGFMQSYNGHVGVQSFVNMNNNDPWFLQIHLRHEIGHCFGLYHTYSGGGDEIQWGIDCNHPDFLCDVFPLNNPSCPVGTAPCNMCYENAYGLGSNNLMGGGASDWISPLQMGRMRRNLHLPFNGIRNYVKEMNSNYTTPWLITSNETWDFDIKMYEDIVVKPGATLTIKCKVAMANNGRIIVERGARLIIDGGEVSAWGSNWTGIQVWGTSNKRQLIASNGLCVDHGIVTIINQGTLRDAIDAISTGKYDQNGNIDWGGYTGGIIRCDGANFINNWRAIQYISYRNFIPITGNPTVDNIGYINNSKFETNDLLKNPSGRTPSVFISLWEVQGVKFYGNTYKNVRTPLPAITDRGSGFYSIDASYYVDRYKVCSVMGTNGCISYSTNNPSTFSNLQYGIHVQNSTPFGNIKINDNDFVNCNRSIYVGGTYNTSVTSNRINVGAGTTQSSLLPYGIYFEFSSAYNISNNSIFTTQTTNYNNSIGTGICINGSNGLNNTLYRNSINMMSVGTAVYGDNQGTNAGDGLKFKCNFYGQGTAGKNMYDIYLGEQWNGPTMWYNGKIDIKQGSATEGANNFFSHTGSTGSNIKSDFYDKGPGPMNSTNAPSTFQYYYNPESSQLTQPWYFNNSLNPISLGTAYSSTMCPATIQVPPMINQSHLTTEKLVNSGLNQGYIIDDRIRTLLGESENGWNEDEIINAIKLDVRKDSKRRLLSALISFGRMEDASLVLNEVKKSNDEEFDGYYKLQEMLLLSKQGTNGTVNLKNANLSKTLLEEMSNDKNSPSSVNAKALLKLIYDEKYEEFMQLPSEVSGKSSFLYNVNEEKERLEPAVQTIVLLPNPTSGLVTIESNEVIKSIIVTAITGSQIFKSNDAKSVDLSGYPTGMYFFTVITESSKKTFKVIKE